MIIQINERYRVTSDPNNVIIQEKRVPKEQQENGASEPIEQKETWVNVSYHPTLISACIKLLDLQIKQSEATTVESLLNELKKMQGEILVAIAKKKKVS
jgi:hypothetical protein